MLSYSATETNGKLTNITETSLKLTATETADEFAANKAGDWFYFIDGINKALYKGLSQISGGTVVKRNDDQSIINAFNSAILIGAAESIIYAIPSETGQHVSDETKDQVKDLITEKIVIQPIIQPIQAQGGESVIVFANETAEPQFEELATFAETWTWQNIAQPVIAKGVKVYNDNIPDGEVRPREYCVFSVDDEVRDTGFADNRNYSAESFVTIIIQGYGNTFENWVVEITNYIHELLRGHRKSGKVYSITNRNIGFDETNNILSRTITFWLKY